MSTQELYPLSCLIGPLNSENLLKMAPLSFTAAQGWIKSGVHSGHFGHLPRDVDTMFGGCLMDDTVRYISHDVKKMSSAWCFTKERTKIERLLTFAVPLMGCYGHHQEKDTPTCPSWVPAGYGSNGQGCSRLLVILQYLAISGNILQFHKAGFKTACWMHMVDDLSSHYSRL